MYILLSLLLLGPCRIVEKVRGKLNHRSSVIILWDVPHPGTLVWLSVDSNNFYIFLVYSTIIAQLRLHIWIHSEAFSTSTVSSWFSQIPYMIVPSLFVGVSFSLFFFSSFILFVGWIVHVHPIKFPFVLFLGITTTIGHLWYYFPLISWLSRIQDC